MHVVQQPLVLIISCILCIHVQFIVLLDPIRACSCSFVVRLHFQNENGRLFLVCMIRPSWGGGGPAYLKLPAALGGWRAVQSQARDNTRTNALFDTPRAFSKREAAGMQTPCPIPRLTLALCCIFSGAVRNSLTGWTGQWGLLTIPENSLSK